MWETIKNALALDAWGMNWWQSLLFMFTGFIIAGLIKSRFDKKKRHKGTNGLNTSKQIRK